MHLIDNPARKRILLRCAFKAASLLPANQRMEPTEPDVVPSARGIGRQLIRTLDHFARAKMGHDFIHYEGGHERFNDFDLWILRHFFVEQSRALEVTQPSEDTTELRKFFEAWDWLGPGVMVGTDFSAFISRSHARWQLVFQLLQRAGDRIAEFGDDIPLSYLEAHINSPTAYCTAAQPTKRFLVDIGRICRLLGEHEPSVV